MRKPLVLLGFICLSGIFLAACAKDLYQRAETRPSLFETETDNRSYIKKAALVLNQGVPTPFGEQVETLFLQSLEERLGGEIDHLQLASRRNSGLPDFLKGQGIFSTSAQTQTVLSAARGQGYHYLLNAGLWHIDPVVKKSGTWIFRKERTYLNLVTALDVYDVVTGAKLVSVVEEDSVKVGLDAYEGVISGMQGDVAAVEKELLAHAERLAETAAQAMSANPWMALVFAVDGGRVLLSADPASGLAPGDRLSVFEGRRTVNGPHGERYVAPGYLLGEIRISSTETGGVLAVMEEPADIQPGDIALPAD